MKVLRTIGVSCFGIITIFAHLSVSVPTPANVANKTLDDSKAPLEFPKTNQTYNLVDNSSIRENLASRTVNDTEVEDLLDVKNKSGPLSIDIPFPEDPTIVDEDLGRKNDTEWIENGEDTEDIRISSEVVEVVRPITVEPITTDHTNFPLFEGQVAAILAGTFLIISIAAYVALMTWRRHLEEVYGSRQMLVSEDEFNDPEDIKHFSI